MNSSSGSDAAFTAARGAQGSAVVHPLPVRAVERHASATAQAQGDSTPWWLALVRPIRWRHVIVAAFVLIYPFFATPFFTFQIGAQSLALGIVALSLTFLGGYGGMVSLAQMTVAGMAAYLLAIFGTSSNAVISLGWPW
ncbi:MAG: hypothetical protein ABI364_00925, partial [Caldimonas sp.]